MANFNFNDFLNTLSEKQKAAVLSCRTEEEMESVIDEFDIEIPDEMLEMVAGGKGKLISALLAGAIAVIGVGAVAAVTANEANVTGNSSSVTVESDKEEEPQEAGRDPSLTEESTFFKVTKPAVAQDKLEDDSSSMNGGNVKHPGEMGYGYTE